VIGGEVGVGGGVTEEAWMGCGGGVGGGGGSCG